MHANELAVHALASQLLAVCRRGFANEHAWLAWRKAHAKEIESLPLDLRNAVCLAWDNACTPEMSK